MLSATNRNFRFKNIPSVHINPEKFVIEGFGIHQTESSLKVLEWRN